MDADLSQASNGQLEQLAYGRTETAEERSRAVEAGAELARRAEERVREARLADPPPVGAGRMNPELLDDLDGDPSTEEGEPWWRRTKAMVAVVLAVLLIAGGAIATSVISSAGPPVPEAFEIFERLPTREERDSEIVFQQAGHISTDGPRLLGKVEYGSIMAWLPRPAGPISETGEDRRSVTDGIAETCIGVVEEHPVFRSDLVNDWQCVELSSFMANGMRINLEGIGGLYDVTWSTKGDLGLSAEVTAEQRDWMDPGFRRMFLEGAAQRARDPQKMAQILSEQTGYTDTDTRVIQESATVSVQGSTESIRSTWSLIVFTGYPDITGASEEVCLAVIDYETVREFACAGVEYMDSGALTLEFVDGDLTNLVTLGSEGDISIFAPIAAG